MVELRRSEGRGALASRGPSRGRGPGPGLLRAECMNRRDGHGHGGPAAGSTMARGGHAGRPDGRAGGGGHLEAPEIFYLVYTRYIPGIFFSRGCTRNIPDIYPEYFFRLKSCFHPFEYIYCFDVQNDSVAG